jgi:hypothetical protein
MLRENHSVTSAPIGRRRALTVILSANPNMMPTEIADCELWEWEQPLPEEIARVRADELARIKLVTSAKKPPPLPPEVSEAVKSYGSSPARSHLDERGSAGRYPMLHRYLDVSVTVLEAATAVGTLALLLVAVVGTTQAAEKGQAGYLLWGIICAGVIGGALLNKSSLGA